MFADDPKEPYAQTPVVQQPVDEPIRNTKAAASAGRGNRRGKTPDADGHARYDEDDNGGSGSGDSAVSADDDAAVEWVLVKGEWQVVGVDYSDHCHAEPCRYATVASATQLCCDVEGCDNEYHIGCLNPAMLASEIPEDEWYDRNFILRITLARFPAGLHTSTRFHRRPYAVTPCCCDCNPHVTPKQR